MDFNWHRFSDRWAERAERAHMPGYELTAFALPGDKNGDQFIGWELYAGDDLNELVCKGEARALSDARRAAEAAYRAQAAREIDQATFSPTGRA